MAERWDLTIFEADGVTPVLGSAPGGVLAEASFSTDPAHPRAFLDVPTTLAESSIDLLKGAARIGEYTLVIADVAPIGDQDAGAFTAILADADGNTAINGRRGLLRTYRNGGWVVAMDGVLSTPELGADRASYSVRLRDVRERERKVRLFARTGTSTVLPRGVLNGYGLLPSGEWLSPPVTPLRGVFRADPAGILSSTGRIVLDGAPAKAGAEAPFALIVTETMLAPLGHTAPVPGVTFPGSDFPVSIYDQVSILWRVEGSGGAWTALSRMSSLFDQGRGIVSTLAGKLKAADGSTLDVRAATAINLSDSGTGALPPNGARVEVVIRYDGPASEAYPFHFEGTAGEFLVAQHNGEFSEAQDGTLPALGLLDDEDAVLALDTPVRIRARKVVDDARAWNEKHIYQPLGAAPALDLQGRISPIRYRLPAEDAELPEINNAIVSPEATWSHPSDNSVNVVRFKYFRDYRVPEADDPLGQKTAGDGIATREVEHEFRFDASEGLLGERAHDIETEAFRALGGAAGSAVNGDVLDETAAQLARERTRQATDRYLFGGQVYGLPCRRAALPDVLRVGDWVLVSASFLPEYSTQRRGANRLCQIVTMKPIDPALVELAVEDAGPANQPVEQPTLGTPTASADGVVSVPVTAVPEGGDARVDYAVSPTEPGPDSGLWIFLDRTDAPATLTSPALPAGVTVWIRARGEKEGRRSSAWTNPVSLETPATLRVLSAVVTVVNGVATVSGRTNALAGAVRIYYASHSPFLAPGLTLYVDAQVVDGVFSATLPLTPRAGAQISVDVEPWSTWTGTAVTGTRGAKYRATWYEPADITSYGLDNFREVPASAPGKRRWAWERAPQVDTVWWAYGVFPAPWTDDNWTLIANSVAQLPDDQDWVEVDEPGADEVGALQVEPRLEDGSIYPGDEVVKRVEVYPIAPHVDLDLQHVIVSGVVDLSLTLAATPSSFPVEVLVFEGDETGTLLAAFTFTEDGTRTKIDDGDLGSRALPAEGMKVWTALASDRAGNVYSDKTEVSAARPPFFDRIHQTLDSDLLGVDFFGRVNDPIGKGGTLEVWVPTGGTTNPNPAAAASASLLIAAGDMPYSFGPSSIAALDGIDSAPGTTLHVILKFTTTDGRTSGQQFFTLEDSMQVLVNTFGQLRAHSVHNALVLLEELQPYFIASTVGDLPADNSAYERAVVLATDPPTTYRWDTGAGGWVETPDVPAHTFAPILIAGVVTAEAIGTGVLKAKLVGTERLDADNLNIGNLSLIADDAGAIVHGSFINAGGTAGLNLEATGSELILWAPGLAITADGDAEFSGTVAATAVVAADSFSSLNATFAGDVNLGLGLLWGSGSGRLVHSSSLVDNETTLHLYIKDADSTNGLYPVLVGPLDSGGAGYRMFRVANF